MKYFVMSDIHIDFFVVKQSKDYNDVVKYYESFYDQCMEPADAVLIAGDIANDYYNQVNFLKFLTTKYEQVYTVFGNHDFGVGHTFGNGNPTKYSEERLDLVCREFLNDPHVHILSTPELVNGIGGTMGMCDFSYLPSISNKEWAINRWQHWYDGKAWHTKKSAWRTAYMVNPVAILDWQSDILMKIVEQQPRIILTHFIPVQAGIAREYENDACTTYFYFDGKEYFEKLDHETWWFCGHVHNKFLADYVNSKGVTIHIAALPSGYPEEAKCTPQYAMVSRWENGRIVDYNPNGEFSRIYEI